MTVDWKNYELVLEATDSSECEVTGRPKGGTTLHSCPVGRLVEGSRVDWKPDYSGYHTVRVTFLGLDDKTIRLSIYNGYEFERTLAPEEDWMSGWYSFGEWDYHVRIFLRPMKRATASGPFFVHTMTDDGVTSDYADAKEAYEGR